MQYTSPEVYKFISQQTWDPIVERKTCEISDTKFPITQKDLEFYDKISPVYNGKKYQIPTPRLCPEERELRRMSRRNVRSYYKRRCALSGNTIVSIYSPNSPYQTVYSIESRRSDLRDPTASSFEVDKDRSIFKQFQSLSMSTPQLCIINDDWVGSENCWYCCDFSRGKDCYLVTWSRDTQTSMYWNNIWTWKWMFDCESVNNAEHVYECINCDGLTNCFYLQNSMQCVECTYGFDLHGCSDCVGCVGLRNAKYCILNQQYTEQEYNEYLKGYILTDLKDQFDILLNTSTRSQNYNLRTSWSYGNHLVDCKNMIFCDDVFEGIDSRYYFAGDRPRYSYDIVQSGENELCYEWVTPDNSFKCCFTIRCRKSTRVYYSDNCHSCSDCFLCSWLRNAQYCIFNKQYTKEEYELLVPQIIEQMQEEWTRGEFFDPSLSPFWYNETVAQEYYPLTREEALARGYKRQDKNYDPVVPAWVEVLQWDQIPMDPDSVDSSILKKILVCEVSGRPYRIIKQELAFYQKHNLPLPRKHPDIRHKERLGRRPGRTLYLRNCDKTWEEILSVYPAYYKGKVYSEKAYQQEVYG